MTKKRNTIHGAIGLVLGIIGGVAGTSFSMGAEKQRVNDLLVRHTSQIVVLKNTDKENAKSNKKEINRLDKMIVDQMTEIQKSIKELTSTVSDVRTDTQVIKAVMERMENDIKALDKH